MITIFQQQIQENAEEIRTDQAKSQRWEQFLLVWKHAGVKKVPVRRIENITQQERLERQLIENLHHTELASVERERMQSIDSGNRESSNLFGNWLKRSVIIT